MDRTFDFIEAAQKVNKTETESSSSSTSTEKGYYQGRAPSPFTLKAADLVSNLNRYYVK